MPGPSINGRAMPDRQQTYDTVVEIGLPQGRDAPEFVSEPPKFFDKLLLLRHLLPPCSARRHFRLQGRQPCFLKV